MNDWDVVGVKKTYLSGEDDFSIYRGTMAATDRACSRLVEGTLKAVTVQLRNGQIIRVKLKEKK